MMRPNGLDRSARDYSAALHGHRNQKRTGALLMRLFSFLSLVALISLGLTACNKAQPPPDPPNGGSVWGWAGERGVIACEMENGEPFQGKWRRAGPNVILDWHGREVRGEFIEFPAGNGLIAEFMGTIPGIGVSLNIDNGGLLTLIDPASQQQTQGSCKFVR